MTYLIHSKKETSKLNIVRGERKFLNETYKSYGEEKTAISTMKYINFEVSV